MEPNFLERAINPQQYDFNDVFWEKEIGLTSPTRKWFWEYLQKFIPLLQNADGLDVGCGTGWLMQLLCKNGVRSMEGFDPSQKSIKIANSLFPSISAYCNNLESFRPQKKYNFIISIMSLGHIAEVGNSFKKLYDWLQPDGNLIVTVPNYKYFSQPRYDYKINIHDINQNEYIAQIERPHWGLISGIVRKTIVYTMAAQDAGFILKEEISMTPTASLIAKAPRYKTKSNETLANLLHFQK